MIERHLCNNGLRIVTEKIPSVRSVAIGIWVKTGSIAETVDNNGISHFIEHMLFKGTTTRSAKEIAESFDEIGGNVNAFTSKEYTCYYARVLDNHAKLALEILSDMFFNSVFDQEELNKEKNVVIEEIGMYEDTPDDLVHDLIAQASYPDHPLGFSILGTEQVLHQLTREDLLNYVEQHYTPQETVVTVAGNFSDDLVEEIKRRFSQFKREGESLSTPAMPQFRPTTILQQKTTEQAHLCLALPGLPVGHEQIYALILLNNLLGGSMSSRLFQEIREQRGLAYSVYSYHSAYQQTGTFTIYTGTAPEQVAEVFEIISSLLQGVKKEGVSERELTKVKEQLKGSLMLSLESTNSRMSRLGKNELLLGKHISLDEVLQRIDRVTTDTILQLANQLFSAEMAISLVSPLETLPENVNPKVLLS